MEITSVHREVGTDVINICDCETKIIKALSWLKRIKYIFQGRRKFALTDVMDFIKRSWWKTYRLAKRERMPSRDQKYVHPQLTCNWKWQVTNFAVNKRPFVFGLSVRRIGFGPRPFHVGFVVDKVDTGTVIFRVFRPSLVIILPLMFLTFTRRATVRSLSTSQQQMFFRKSEGIRSKSIFTGKICHYVFLTLPRLDTWSVQSLGYGPDLRGNMATFSAEVRDLLPLRIVQTGAGVYAASYSMSKASEEWRWSLTPV
jgi:hypothetical protein